MRRKLIYTDPAKLVQFLDTKFSNSVVRKTSGQLSINFIRDAQLLIRKEHGWSTGVNVSHVFYPGSASVNEAPAPVEGYLWEIGISPRKENYVNKEEDMCYARIFMQTKVGDFFHKVYTDGANTADQVRYWDFKDEPTEEDVIFNGILTADPFDTPLSKLH